MPRGAASRSRRPTHDCELVRSLRSPVTAAAARCARADARQTVVVAAAVDPPSGFAVHRPRIRSFENMRLMPPSWTAAQSEGWFGCGAMNLTPAGGRTARLGLRVEREISGPIGVA